MNILSSVFASSVKLPGTLTHGSSWFLVIKVLIQVVSEDQCLGVCYACYPFPNIRRTLFGYRSVTEAPVVRTVLGLVRLKVKW